MADDMIRTTENHPFYVKGKGWVHARDLMPGDELRDQNGRYVKVRKTVDSGQTEPVFNLQVAGAHTYFVTLPMSGQNVLVHNVSVGSATSWAWSKIVSTAAFAGDVLYDGADFSINTVAGWVEGNFPATIRAPSSGPGAVGRRLGRDAALLQSTVETVGGGGVCALATGSMAFSLGGDSLIAVPMDVIGGVVAVHGVAVGIHTMMLPAIPSTAAGSATGAFFSSPASGAPGPWSGTPSSSPPPSGGPSTGGTTGGGTPTGGGVSGGTGGTPVSGPRSALDILMPGGRPVGRPGASSGIRRLNGGLPAAQKVFNELGAGGKDITPPKYPGKIVELPNGGRVGLRPVSSSDGTPAICEPSWRQRCD